MSLGKTYQVEISALSNSGDGVGRINDKVIFVPYTAPGDTVLVELIKDKKKFSLGRKIEVISPSPHRIEPRCKYFETCGGCDWQHLSYEDQLAWKQKHLLETLEKIGGLKDLPLQPLIPSPSPWHYRNRVQGEIKNQKFHFRKKGENTLVPVDHCAIAEEPINKLLNSALKHPQRQKKVELSVSGDSVSILPISTSRTTELGFRQVNRQVTQKLEALHLEQLNKRSYTSVFDLYCGRGHWTRELAQAFENTSFLGIEASPENIKIAEKSLQANPLPNLKFQLGLVEDLVRSLDLTNSLCIVDPPRAGLAPPVIKALEGSPASHLIYVSCHPATLARDLKALTENAYAVETLQPLDMFPQTSHLETWVLLRSKAL